MSLGFILNPIGKEGGKMARKKNPTGVPKSARGRQYRSLVKKHGVLKAARIWRGKKGKPARKVYKPIRRMAANPSPVSGGYHLRPSIRRPMRYSPISGLSGVTERAEKRKSRKIRKSRKSKRRYASNPAAMPMIKQIGSTAIPSGESLKHILVAGCGLTGCMVGGAVANKLVKGGKPLVEAIGNIAGSVGAGIITGYATKSVKTGKLAAYSGLSLSAFKYVYSKFLAGKERFGLTFPGLGDYVEFEGVDQFLLPDEVSSEVPSGDGVNDYVEFEGTGQFLPETDLEEGEIETPYETVY